MITLIEARNFRCLRYVSQPMGAFHVLVGPNASGKTTFLDVVSFLGDLVSDGLMGAVNRRTENFQDLTWNREGASFDLVIEAAFPEHLGAMLRDQTCTRVRYEVSIGMASEDQEVQILAETVLLRSAPSNNGSAPLQPEFPQCVEAPTSVLMGTRGQGTRTVVNKVNRGNDNFYSEVYKEKGKGWAPAYKLGPRKSALGNLPEDETQFPVSTWLKQFLSNWIQQFMLNSLLIRKASPPGQGKTFKPDGSNLPWVVNRLEEEDKGRVEAWVRHLRTALPDIAGIRTVLRQDDRHRYLMLRYDNGLEVPSWMASDGTLRLLALTLPAYIADLKGVYLIEEPENGIHPRAIETVYQSLSSVYDAQMILATHSPVLLGMVEPAKLLCFAKDATGATDIVSGDLHPLLREWQGETSLSSLFAAGVLG